MTRKKISRRRREEENASTERRNFLPQTCLFLLCDDEMYDHPLYSTFFLFLPLLLLLLLLLFDDPWGTEDATPGLKIHFYLLLLLELAVLYRYRL